MSFALRPFGWNFRVLGIECLKPVPKICNSSCASEEKIPGPGSKETVHLQTVMCRPRAGRRQHTSPKSDFQNDHDLDILNHPKSQEYLDELVNELQNAVQTSRMGMLKNIPVSSRLHVFYRESRRLATAILSDSTTGTESAKRGKRGSSHVNQQEVCLDNLSKQGDMTFSVRERAKHDTEQVTQMFLTNVDELLPTDATGFQVAAVLEEFYQVRSHIRQYSYSADACADQLWDGITGSTLTPFSTAYNVQFDVTDPSFDFSAVDNLSWLDSKQQNSKVKPVAGTCDNNNEETLKPRDTIPLEASLGPFACETCSTHAQILSNEMPGSLHSFHLGTNCHTDYLKMQPMYSQQVSNELSSGTLHCTDTSPRQPEKNQSPSQDPYSRPNLDQLRFIQDYFANYVPKYFKQSQDYRLYRQDVVFENNLLEKPYTTVGLGKYAWEVAKYRAYAHLKYANVRMHVLKITAHEDEGSVRIRWRVSGIPQAKAFMFWKFLPWNFTKSVDNESIWLDGFSTLYVGGDGMIYRHTVDKVIPEKKEEVTTAADPLPVGASL